MNRNNKAPEADGQFVNAPYFNFNDDKLKFDTNDVDDANSNYGSASALLPVCHVSQKESNADSFLFVTVIFSTHQASDQFLEHVLANSDIVFHSRNLCRKQVEQKL